MAQQTITGGNGTTGQTGEEVKDIINENFTELYGLSPLGVQWFPISVAAMAPRDTYGCTILLNEEMTTSVANIKYLEFDETTQQFAQVQVVFPPKVNLATIRAKFYWKPKESGSGSVEWGLRAGAYSDGDVLTTALGTAQVITDAFIGTTANHISDWTPAITIGNSPADGDLIMLEISRNPASGGDTLNVKTRLEFIVIELITTAANDV